MDKIKKLKTAPDKSITHRAIILSSIAKGHSIIKNPLISDDTLRTIKAMKMLGVDLEIKTNTIVIHGKGKTSLKEPFDVLYMGNSGTSARLLSGLISANNFTSFLTGDDSLKKRPMGRIIEPLSKMGANIIAREDRFLPIAIKGTYPPRGIVYKTPVASAQVKSAILIAGLYSEEKIEVIEPSKSRDHTENMLKAFGVSVEVDSNRVSLGKNRELTGGFKITIPSDISSAAFFMVYTAIRKNADLILTDVLLNPTRSGILEVFRMAGVKFEIISKKTDNFENIGDILVKYTENLNPFTIKGDLIPTLIDEIPILSILAIFCDGKSYIKDATELRKKESDRIASICSNLRKIGVTVEEFEDGFAIEGKRNPKLIPAYINTHFDHRIAMSFMVLKSATGLNLKISEMGSISTSYPNFLDHLNYVSS